MTEFTIGNYTGMSLEKWIAQNDGIITDSYDGSLLDNYAVDCKHGQAFIFENYVNSNASNYRVYFFRENEIDKTAAYEKISKLFYNGLNEYLDYLEERGF